MKKVKISRRQFILNSALMGGAMFLPSMAKAEKTSINGKMNIALIGVGGIGSLTISTLKKCPEARISALCDVDDTRIAGGAKEYPNAPKFRDFRRMLDKMGKEIDGVAISTPDHMHFPIAAWALKAGKHVFCQKPLVRTVWEARKLREIASKSGLITQMGNQGHTNDGWRVIKEWYDAGIIGKIEEIHCWTDRPIWPQGFSKRPPEEAVPASLDYKLWLGVAPQAPYSPRSTHFNWRGYRDYGTGAGGDMACHILDASYSAFELGLPYRISGEATEYTDISWPKQTTAHLEFRNPRGVKGKIMLNWYDGGRKPKNVKRVDQSFIDDPKTSNGTLIVGTKETVFTTEYGGNPIIFPRERMVEMKRSGALPAPSVPRSKYPWNPQAEWVKACFDNKQPPANFDYASEFTELSLLMLVPIFEKGKLIYDAEKMAFPRRESANKYLSSLYEYNKEFMI